MLTFFEFVAVVTALIYIYFAAKEKNICFLFGLISSLIYVYISFQARYYFDSFLNAYYVVMSIVGWFNWRSHGNHQSAVIKKLTHGKLAMLILGGLLLSFVLGYFTDRNTDASLAYLDSFTTVFALIATWMVVEKYIENWLIWIVVDGIGIGMYFWKELYFTAGLFLIYTIIVIIGYFEWKKKMKLA